MHRALQQGSMHAGSHMHAQFSMSPASYRCHCTSPSDGLLRGREHACRDDQLLNEESAAQQDASASHAHAHAHAAMRPGPSDGAHGGHVQGSFPQPSSQGPYDAVWFRQSHSFGGPTSAEDQGLSRASHSLVRLRVTE